MTGCRDCNRTEFIRRAVAEAGRGLPGHRAGYAAPGRDGHDPARVRLAQRRARARRLRWRQPLELRVRRRHRAAPPRRPRPTRTSSSRSSSPAGSTGSLCSSRPATRRYYQLRPNLALPQTAGIAYSGDSRLRWNPAATSIATLYGEGKVSVIPAIGYADSDLSHFTSRHYWEVGATDAATTHRLARPLPRHRRDEPTTRCRGSRSTLRSSRRSRRPRCPSRPCKRRTSTASRCPGCRRTRLPRRCCRRPRTSAPCT